MLRCFFIAPSAYIVTYLAPIFYATNVYYFSLSAFEKNVGFPRFPAHTSLCEARAWNAPSPGSTPPPLPSYDDIRCENDGGTDIIFYHFRQGAIMGFIALAPPPCHHWFLLVSHDGATPPAFMIDTTDIRDRIASTSAPDAE